MYLRHYRAIGSRVSVGLDYSFAVFLFGGNSIMESERKKGERITIGCAIGNLILTGLKLFAGIVSDSKGMIADALHSGSDVVATIVVYIGMRISKKPADEHHTYGHGKVEYMASLFVAATLFYAGVSIVKSVIESFLSGDISEPGIFAGVIAAVSIIAKEAMFRITIKQSKIINSPSMIANAWDHRSDAYSSIGTLLGVILSIIGKQYGIEIFRYADSVAAIIVGGMIVRISYRIFLDATDGLMDHVPDIELVKAIEEEASNFDKINRINWIKSRSSGSGIIVDLAIEVDEMLIVRDAHAISEDFKIHLMEKNKRIDDIHIHIDPSEEA